MKKKGSRELRSSVRITTLLTLVAIFVMACGGEENFPLEDDEIGKVEQAIGCNCWPTTYDEHWVDPNNPGSGEHVVVWYNCSTYNYNPRILTDWPWQYYKRNWMVWNKHPLMTYQVFVNGWYWWTYRVFYPPWTVISSIHLD